MKEKSKDYIKGFRHGVSWTLIYLGLFPESKIRKYLKKTDKASKEAIKSLKEGRY